MDLEEGCIKKTDFLFFEEEEKEMQGENVDDCRPSLRHGILCLSARTRCMQGCQQASKQVAAAHVPVKLLYSKGVQPIHPEDHVYFAALQRARNLLKDFMMDLCCWACHGKQTLNVHHSKKAVPKDTAGNGHPASGSSTLKEISHISVTHRSLSMCTAGSRRQTKLQSSDLQC